jgi:hypothetical protein
MEIVIAEIHVYYIIMKRKFKQWWSTIPPIYKQTITSHRLPPQIEKWLAPHNVEIKVWFHVSSNKIKLNKICRFIKVINKAVCVPCWTYSDILLRPVLNYYIISFLQTSMIHALKKIAPSGGRREHFWGISCEKSRFYAKKLYFFQF